MKRALLCCILVLNLWSAGDSLAFDNVVTHRNLTERATEYSNLAITAYLKDNLGFMNGADTLVGGRSITKWLQEGSFQEDEPACRASNHFHNPLRNWTESGMRDEPWFVSLRCILSDYPSSKIKSNVVWATGYTAPIADNAYKSSTGNTWIGEQRKSVLLC